MPTASWSIPTLSRPPALPASSGDDSRAKHDAPCAFAGPAPALLVEASPPVVPPMAVAPGVATSGVGIGTGLAAPPPPATGPPPSLI